MAQGQPWAFDCRQPPGGAFSLNTDWQAGSQCCSLSDDGLALGRPGAKGQKENREAVKSSQRLFVLESIGAHSLLFTYEEPQAQKREPIEEDTSLMTSRTWSKSQVPFFQISDGSVSAPWLSGLTNKWQSV